MQKGKSQVLDLWTNHRFSAYGFFCSLKSSTLWLNNLLHRDKAFAYRGNR